MTTKRVAQTAEALLIMWKDLVVRSGGDPWAWQGQRQGYQDALNAMKFYGLINDYDLSTCTVT